MAKHVPKVVDFPQIGVSRYQKVLCEYEVLLHMSLKGATVRACRHAATVKVGKHPYCTRHAGAVLVQMLIEKDGKDEST